jgi:homogentisate 1,2-dioxygenase
MNQEEHVASITRKGKIPHPPTGIGEHVDQVFTVGGFFGPWTSIFRRRNLAHPKAWSDDSIIYQGVDAATLIPTDATEAEGVPLELMAGASTSVAISRRSEPAPFAEKLVDRHQIRFQHRGRCLLETELGPLAVEPGDFVVIPANLIYRERPLTDDHAALIFETEQPVALAESLWDSVGFAGAYIDYSEMELPAPEEGAGGVGDPTRVRLRDAGEWHWMEFDFDPCRDATGWLGDPILYKLSSSAIPGIGTTSGFLTPPANAVLWGEGKEFFFNVMGPRPFPATPPPRGSYGAPSHLNDYDEVWFNHASEFSRETDSHLWLLPRTIPHPGLKRPPEYPENPVRQIDELKLNFDTKDRLRWTEAGRAAFMPDPQVSLYTSLYGAHIGIVPEEVKAYTKA